MTSNRDDFPDLIKRTLAGRVGYRCSRPECRANTTGPQVDSSKALNVGVAAHITAAANGGPRFDPSLSAEQRADAANGIWLCQTCAKLVDNDPLRYSAEILRKWKSEAEHEALQTVGRTAGCDRSRANIVDKWVSLGYEHKAGIVNGLKEQGFELGWVSADREAEKIEFGGWDYVLIEQPDGSRARLKIHDAPVIGGYLVLLKKRKPSGP